MATLAKMGRTVAVPLLAKRLGIVTKSVRCMACKLSQTSGILLICI